jgi:hypothetical protein
MAQLTAADRNAMPQSQFALPGGRYPIPDASHAANAKARATQQYNAGSLSADQRAVVDQKANAKLHPRDHSLAMASADHLHRQGYIGPQQHQAIRGEAQARMAAHKAAGPAPRAFGSLG